MEAVGTSAERSQSGRVVPRVLDSMPRFVRGHADTGDGIRGIDRLGERQLLRHRVVVVRQHAVGADNLHVGDARPAQQGRRGLGAREPALAPDVRIPVEGALHPRARPEREPQPWQEEIHRVEEHCVTSAWRTVSWSRRGSILPLSAGHACASLAVARSSFGHNGGGDDGAPQPLISAWSSLWSAILRRPHTVFNARGHPIAQEGYDEGKRLQLKLEAIIIK